MRNNFTLGDSHCSLIACLIDDTLSKNNRMITARQVLATYCHHDDDYFDETPLKAIPYYHDYREAVSNIAEYLKEKGLSLVYANGKTSEDGFMYPIENTNPLQELRIGYNKKLDKTILEQFCKACIGIVPDVMLNHFFEGTMLLLNATNTRITGRQFVQTGTYTHLEHIEILPSLYVAIMEKKVVNFHYHPFNNDVSLITCHPHYLREYNGRWFLFGLSIDNQGGKHWNSAYALDRIESEITYTNHQYLPQHEGYWENKFKDIVGVRLPSKDVLLENIIIKTLNPQVHGRIMTKKIHESQLERIPFDEELGYGEITISVRPNPELLAVLLSHGSNIEIVGNYRGIIEEELQKMYSLYKKT